MTDESEKPIVILYVFLFSADFNSDRLMTDNDG